MATATSPQSEKSPRTPTFTDSNPAGILNWGTPITSPKKIKKERSRHETPGSIVDRSTFRANPDVVKELLVCLAKGWAPETTDGSELLCGIHALYQAFQNIMGGGAGLAAFKLNALIQGIQSNEFKIFHRNIIKERFEKIGLFGTALDETVEHVMVQGNFGAANFYSIEQLAEFVRFINKQYNVTFRLGLVSSQKDQVASAYIVESDDPLNELHYKVLWLHNVNDRHWESFGPNPSTAGRTARNTWALNENLAKVVNNGLYRVKAKTQGIPEEYTLTALIDQWVFQVAPPKGLPPRDGFIYVHTTKGPNQDSWRVIGKTIMGTIRDQEGFIPLASLEVVSSYKYPRPRKGMNTVERKPTNILDQQNRPRTPPPGPYPPTPGRTPGSPTGTRPGCNTHPGEGATPGGEDIPPEEPTDLPPQITIPPEHLPPTPGEDGPNIRGPVVTAPQCPQTKQPEPPIISTQAPPAKQPDPPIAQIQVPQSTQPQPPNIQILGPITVQPIPLPTPRPKKIGLNAPLTIKIFLARRSFAPPQRPNSTRSQSLGSRPRLPPGRPKSRTMADFTATRNQKNDWARTRFVNFFIADVPDVDENGRRFGADHDQPYHQDQVLLTLDDTYEPDVPGPVRVRTIDEDEGWAHSANLRKVTNPFGLDLNSATTQYSMDPNEAFREDLYPTSFLRGMCQGSGINSKGSRQEMMEGLTAKRMELGVPLILYRVIESEGAFIADDLVRVPGDPLEQPERTFRAFGLEPHKRGYVRGGNLILEPRSWGVRVRPHVHARRVPYGLKWAQPPASVKELVAMGSRLSLHGVNTPPESDNENEEEEKEEERRLREAGLAPAATVVLGRHPGQVYTTKDGKPSFFTPLPASKTGQMGQASQTPQAGQKPLTPPSPQKRVSGEQIGSDGKKRRVSQK
ncbi:hypothetical protein V494_00885 [Pseudogymnoascus sp. VKM F-4513 (FW-928)]|nr:hypothetical protein V494_00885 [Pseudogymnoascus sp. VKM F-4513 (FW-928)]